ncbi:MAG: cupredoxin domain-containing protein [Actinomycetota bacterium]
MTKPTGLKWSRSSKRATLSAIAVTAAALLTLTACGGGSNDTAATDTAATDTAVTLVEALPAGQWISYSGDFKEAANWDTAQTLTLELGAGTITPSNLELVAGQPYVIEISNTDSVEHGLSALDFMRASAVRKAESPGAEIKVTLFKEIYVLPGKMMELFVVPVIPGVTAMNGLTDGVADASMTGTISVTGTAPTTPAPVIDPFSTVGEVAGAADLIAAAKATWSTDATAVTFEMNDNGDAHFYSPKTVTLKVGKPAILTFANKGNIQHVFVAEDFFKTAAFWKVVNAEGSVFGGMARGADLEVGGASNMYLIPTKVGTYKLTDDSAGMESMQATIIVK